MNEAIVRSKSGAIFQIGQHSFPQSCERHRGSVEYWSTQLGSGRAATLGSFLLRA
jgi:hypothetical protein